jgi:hypothetical protein
MLRNERAIVHTAANTEELALSRRDWILLPRIAVATIAFLMAVSEVAARIVWPEQEDSDVVRGGPSGQRLGLDVDQVMGFDDRRDIAIDELAAVIVHNPRFGVLRQFLAPPATRPRLIGHRG